MEHNGEVAEVTERLEKSLSMDTEDEMASYHRHIQDAKDAARQGDLQKALKIFKLAHNIHPSQKLESRIKKIEELLSQDDSEEDSDDFVDVNGSGLMLFRDLYDKLYDYQRNGVAFLYSLYRDGLKGGILADDMGLGKTIQVISFLSGMYDNELVKHTLLIMPTSLITNWTKEFSKWTPGMRVKEFHGTSKGERTRNLEKVQRRGGVVITTYTMLLNNWQQLSSFQGREFTWDYMILDEAHKIKSTSTKTAKSAYAIPSKNRVLLTGTPVQNNLREMWALFDFACQGTLLGTAKTFKSEYENPITRAREKDATPGERVLGSRMSENLMATIKPHFLRRTKSEVQKNKTYNTHPRKEEDSDHNNGQIPNRPNESGAVMPTLTRKNDLIVWTYLSSVQEDIYRQFLSLDHIQELLMTTRSPLAQLNILKKLCDHPRLLSPAAIAKLGLEETSAESQQSDDLEADAGHSIANVPDESLISESGKLVFLFALLERLRQEGHRTLIFAHYRKVLDIIERILGNRGFKVMRLDGTITQVAERERRISLFQTDDRYSVFLLTTQVGGVGITLTAANRVVIYDPSWNPATDAQAVDRAYRIGQTENVVIYRLITCGTVEEKIYRRQVFKDSLIRQNTGDKKNPFRYFSKQELKELFTLEDARSSSTQMQLQAMHSRSRRTDPELDKHIAHLHGMEIFGISDHDLMFSLDVNHDEAPEDQQEQHYIEGRVQKAQELMKAESELQMQLAESMASSTEPAWLRQPTENRRRSHEKKVRDPDPSNARHDEDFSRSPAVVDLVASDSGKESSQQDLSDQVIDLTADDCMTDQQPPVDVNQDTDDFKHQSVKQEGGYSGATVESPQEMLQDSLAMLKFTAEAVDNSIQSYITANDEDELQLNGKTQDPSIDSEHPDAPALKNKSLSVLQASSSSFKADTPSRMSAGFESLEGNFNLQLEDSDMFSENDVLDHQGTEAEERKFLSQLQMEGTFDVNKSLSERQLKESEKDTSINDVHTPEIDDSVNDSILTTKKKRTAVIYDSDEDDDERPDSRRGQLENSFLVLGASTPKSFPSDSTPIQSRKTIGGNSSVASRRSFIQSIINDMENNHHDDEGEDEDVSASYSDEADEEDIIDATSDELQVEETVGETLNTEGEEDEEGEEEQEYEENSESADDIMSSNLEESTSDPELASSERMDQCTVDVEVNTVEDSIQPESYDSLVGKGRDLYSKGKLEDALSYFLRAIDIKPGDPEIQLMTIQLYRKLSQRS
ncbi:DNA excision repair protein ERCC-6-like [Antennarius striatus]|uniref:DNA excision repair protein ERCC-6-like n=1 Tax=Antennarius striatus TaxID=241820 RepID=UPI0035AEC993